MYTVKNIIKWVPDIHRLWFNSGDGWILVQYLLPPSKPPSVPYW